MFGDTPFADLPPSQDGDKIQTSTKRKGRRGTRLRKLTVSRNADQGLPIQFDMQTGKALGDNSTKFTS